MRKILTIGLIGVMILNVSGCGKETKTTKAEGAAKPETLQVVEAFGTVKSTEVKTIKLDFTTEVTKVNVVEGQRVKNGDALVSLNTRDYQSLIRNKELEFKTLQIELSGLNREYEVKRSSLTKNTDPDIMRYINDKKHAEDLYTKALDDFTAREALYQAGAVSLNELKEFEKTVNEKNKSMEDAVFSEGNTRKEIQQELDRLRTSIDQKSLQATAKELDLQAMQEKMHKSYIKGNDIIADVSNGVVSEIGCVQGDVVTADQEKKLLTILNRDSVVIEANVAEEFIKDVKIGAEVTINPQADKSRTYKGNVLSIAEKAVQKNNETIIPVRISIENLDNFLLPEFNVDVKIKFESKKQV